MKPGINPSWMGILELYDRCVREAGGNEGVVAVITKRKQEAVDIIEEIEKEGQNSGSMQKRGA